MRPETSVIVVTYNSANDIADCLNALGRHADVEVIVVDNASSDATVVELEALRSAGIIDQLVLSDENLGFAKAVNAGIGLSSGTDVLLLNPDASLEREDLLRLRDGARLDHRIGIAAPVVFSGSAVKVMSAGRQPTIWAQVCHFSGMARAFPRVENLKGRHLYLDHHADRDQLVEWVSGCCMYITRTALDTVGVLSERWFMYGEDIEYCRRVSVAGLKVVVLSQAKAQHLVGASVHQAGERVSTLWAENTYDYYVSEFRPNWAARSAWRVVFSGGMLSRAAVLRVRATRGDDAAGSQARRFEKNAFAVWRIPRAGKPEAKKHESLQHSDETDVNQ
jgi:GT2 family glycosyltransferase